MTVTVIDAAGLTQALLASVCVTLYVVVPAVAVEGVGAVEEPAPLTAPVYQDMVFEPAGVAERVVAEIPCQYVKEEGFTVGAAGTELTVTVTGVMAVLGQPLKNSVK